MLPLDKFFAIKKRGFVALVYVYSLNKKVFYKQIEEDVVILSPSLYWFKICTIPTKKYAKAKNIAMHMMSERPEKFSDFILYKKNDLYDAYAYDKAMLKNLLKELGLKNPKVYFANQLHLSDALSIDEQNMLYNFNQRVMQTKITNNKPLESLVENYTKLLDGEKPIKSFVKSDQNQTKMLIGILGLFFLYIVLFSFDKINTLSIINDEFASIKNQDKSFYEMQSLIKRYTKLENKSLKLKKELKNALKSKNLKSIVYENDAVKVENEK
jgi:hypothetical protein